MKTDPVIQLAISRVNLGIAWIHDGLALLPEDLSRESRLDSKKGYGIPELQAQVALGALSQLKRSLKEAGKKK